MGRTHNKGPPSRCHSNRQELRAVDPDAVQGLGVEKRYPSRCHPNRQEGYPDPGQLDAT